MSTKERFYEKLQQIREDYEPVYAYMKKVHKDASNEYHNLATSNRRMSRSRKKQLFDLSRKNDETSKKYDKKAVTGLDEEQLDEVSASKLGRYLAKASKQKKNIQDRMNAGIDGTGEGISRRTFRTGMRRVRGTENAIKKLTGTAKVPAAIKEEQLDELRKPRDPDKGRKYISGGARAAEDAAAKKYYDKYDDETAARRKAIKSKSDDDKKAAETAKGEREKAAKRVIKLQKIKEEQINEISKAKKDRYVERAASDEAMASFSARVADKKDKAKFENIARKRRKGLKLALKKKED